MAEADRTPHIPRLHHTPARALRLRLQRLIRDAGQTDLAPEGTSTVGPTPFWEIEPTPLVIDAAEWKMLSTALVQRARLINAFLRDIYTQQSALKERLLPPEIILADPYYRRPCLHLEPDRANPATILRFDLIKTAAEGWMFSGLLANTPIGLSYAVQNRRFLSQEASQLYSGLPDYHSIINFPLHLLESLRQLSPRGPREASVVVLTAGPQDPFYSEHSFLARKMGLPLARGDDLLVLDNCVYFKTIAGLERVDVIYRRLADAHIDPVVFSTHRETAGVPGLLQCVRQRTVVVANAIGSGLAESRALDAFLPTLSRYYFGENLRLPSVPTYLCSDSDVVEAAIARHPELRLRRTHASLIDPSTPEVLLHAGDPFPHYVRQAPHHYVLQPALQAESIVPGAKRQSGFTLSAFVLAQGSRFRILPGGLVQIGARPSPFQRIGVTADVVVLQDSATTHSEAETSSDRSLTEQAPLTPLGSRSAENLYWLGRYLERAESTARMLSIFDDVALEEIPARDRRKWLPVWQGLLEATGHGGHKITSRVSPQVVLSASLAWRMALDPNHSSSIFSSVQSACDNARQLRDSLSPEVWVVLSHLRDKLQELQSPGASSLPDAEAKSQEELARNAVQNVVHDVNALWGTAERTLLQDASWHFLRIGLHLERAIMTCSSLRHILGALEAEASTSPSVVERDNPELSALLRMLGSQDAYRRLYQAPSLPPLVSELFLQQPTAPRSIQHNVTEIMTSLNAIEALPHGENTGSEAVRDAVGEIVAFLERLKFARVATQPGSKEASDGLGDQLSQLLNQLYGLHSKLSDHYFSHQARLPSKTKQIALF